MNPNQDRSGVYHHLPHQMQQDESSHPFQQHRASYYDSQRNGNTHHRDFQQQRDTSQQRDRDYDVHERSDGRGMRIQHSETQSNPSSKEYLDRGHHPDYRRYIPPHQQSTMYQQPIRQEYHEAHAHYNEHNNNNDMLTYPSNYRSQEYHNSNYNPRSTGRHLDSHDQSMNHGNHTMHGNFGENRFVRNSLNFDDNMHPRSNWQPHRNFQKRYKQNYYHENQSTEHRHFSKNYSGKRKRENEIEPRKRPKENRFDHGKPRQDEEQFLSGKRYPTSIFKGKFKGALLHTHFSGTVRTSTLLDFLLNDSRCMNKVHFNRNSLSWISENCKLVPNFSTGNRHRIEGVVNRAWKSDFRRNFKILGGLLFNVIKNEEFYPLYLDLIFHEMEVQNLDHIELRLKLGSVFRYDESGKFVFRTLEEELDLLLQAKEKFEEKGRSFIIIAQSSKHAKPEAVKEYFLKVMNLMKSNESYRDLIKGFDLVGNENEGNPLEFYEDVFQTVQQQAKDWNLEISFLFHAGEDLESLNKSLHNLDLAVEYGSKRIGHGIHAIEDKHILEKVRKSGMILEFCPLSMQFFNNLGRDTLEKFRASGLKYCINSDDSNKIYDTDMDFNIEFLLSSGYKDIEIIEAIKVSIEASQCSEAFRKQMMEKWKAEYQDQLLKSNTANSSIMSHCPSNEEIINRNVSKETVCEFNESNAGLSTNNNMYESNHHES